MSLREGESWARLRSRGAGLYSCSLASFPEVSLRETESRLKSTEWPDCWEGGRRTEHYTQQTQQSVLQPQQVIVVCVWSGLVLLSCHVMQLVEACCNESSEFE